MLYSIRRRSDRPAQFLIPSRPVPVVKLDDHYRRTASKYWLSQPTMLYTHKAQVLVGISVFDIYRFIFQ